MPSYNKKISTLLQDYKQDKLSEAELLKELRLSEYEDLGFAKIDHARSMRKGFPEVVYCAGKTNAQSLQIIEKLSAAHDNVLATRANPELFAQVQSKLPAAKYNELARSITIEKAPLAKDPQHVIAVITAGTSDIPVAEEAAVTAEIMGNQVDRIYDVGVAGIQRLFDNLPAITSANVLIVVAGMEGALASVVGGLVDKPILAVPTSVGYGANFAGLSALLGMLNSCSSGVAVMNIDNGFGAGRMASIINQLR